MEINFLTASIPLVLNCPQEMIGPVNEVLAGEYETGYYGDNLTILDIGANVGSFSLWANMRWPKSKIYAFEPHPETFEMLIGNLKHLDNVICHNAAVFPSEKKTELLYTRYAGDGESGLVEYMGKIFDDLNKGSIFEVPVIHPKDLPQCDIIKIDTEGAEYPILKNMDLSDISLILLEYHDVQDRDNIKQLLHNFLLEREDNFDYSHLLQDCKEVFESIRRGDLNPEEFEFKRLLNFSTYKESLSGNFYGRLFFASQEMKKLKKYLEL